MPSPGERVAVSESMNCDLSRVSVWCNLWGMKLNASKTMIVSRPCTVHPQLTPLTLDGTVPEESDDLVLLGKSLLWPGASQWRIYYHRMWVQLSTTCSNLLK